MQGDQRDDDYFGLAEILRVFGRRWQWIAGSVIGLAAIALLLSLQQDAKYVATTRLLLRTAASDAVLVADPNAEVPFFADRQLANQIQVIQSSAVQAAVQSDYDGNLSVGEVSAHVAEAGSDALELSVTSTDPDAAADLVNLYAKKYIEFSQRARFDALEEANEQIQSRIASINDKRDALSAPLATLNAQVNASPNSTELRQQQAALILELQPQLDALDDLQSLYTRTQENLALTQNLAATTVAQVLSAASPPTDPVSPKPVRDAVIGLMAGIGVGLALALAREFLDNSIRNSDDLERVIRGRYPILGVIPEVPATEIAALPGPGTNSMVAEAYRALRTSVRFAELDRPMKVIQITSGSAGEGKTTTAANLARMLTQAGHRVAVACCDMRRPTIHNLFDVQVAPGLADVVVGERTLAEAISQTDPLTYVLPAGTSPPNPSELLGSSRAERVVAALADEMDYTVIDTTPVLAVTDSIVVSRFCDATLVVVRAGSTTRRELEHSLAALELASAPIIGLVLNRAPVGDRNPYGYSYGGGYGYGYGYGRTRGEGPATAEGAAAEQGTPTSVG